YVRIDGDCRCAEREIVDGSQKRAIVKHPEASPDDGLAGFSHLFESPKQFAAERVPRYCYSRTEVRAVIENRFVIPSHSKRQCQVRQGLPLILNKHTDNVVRQIALCVDPLDEAAGVVRKKIVHRVEGVLASGGEQIFKDRPYEL